MKEFLDKYMPPNYAAHGGELDAINAYVHWLMLILFVIWGALFAYMLWRFRASRNPRADYHGTRSHLSTYGEVGVAIVEVVLLVGFSIPAWYRWTKKPAPDTNPLEVRVIAEQFAWNVHYAGPDNVFGKTNLKLISSSNPLGLDPDDPDGKDDILSLNHLHLEVNRPVIVRITSKDVIHSFALQEMRVKQDAIPGMEVPIHFTPIRASDPAKQWEITCAQLCGLGHYRMRGMYTVHSREDFEGWMRQNTPAAGSPVPAAGS